jgi:hypothetical protein
MTLKLSFGVLARLSCCAGLLLLVAGCGPSKPKADVSGKVTYQSKPVPGGNVIFEASDGKQFTGSIDPADGAYTVLGIEVGGEMKVAIENKSLQPQGAAMNPMADPSKFGGKQPPPGSGPMKPPEGITMTGGTGKYIQLPSKYYDPKTSGITFTPQKGKQEFPIDLK